MLDLSYQRLFLFACGKRMVQKEGGREVKGDQKRAKVVSGPKAPRPVPMFPQGVDRDV